MPFERKDFLSPDNQFLSPSAEEPFKPSKCNTEAIQNLIDTAGHFRQAYKKGTVIADKNITLPTGRKVDPTSLGHMLQRGWEFINQPVIKNVLSDKELSDLKELTDLAGMEIAWEMTEGEYPNSLDIISDALTELAVKRAIECGCKEQ